MSDTPTKLSPANLAALMCGRVCHDLISPVGALGTALEVLSDSNNADMHEDALELIKLSATQASAKLQYLRLAFGAGTSAPGMVSFEQIRKLVDDFYLGSKIKIEWEAHPDGLDKSQARLFLNMLLIIAQGIPRGGTIRLGATGANPVKLSLIAEGVKARIDPNLQVTLSGKAPEGGFDGRTIQSFYTGMIGRELKAVTQMMLDEETITMVAEIPHQAVQSAA